VVVSVEHLVEGSEVASVGASEVVSVAVLLEGLPRLKEAVRSIKICMQTIPDPIKRPPETTMDSRLVEEERASLAGLAAQPQGLPALMQSRVSKLSYGM
jgi:hypothetical protein